MSNLDNRISNADQLLTNDIDKFCESVTDLYSNASKPILDILIYMYRLTTTIGAKVNDDVHAHTIKHCLANFHTEYILLSYAFCSLFVYFILCFFWIRHHRFCCCICFCQVFYWHIYGNQQVNARTIRTFLCLTQTFLIEFYVLQDVWRCKNKNSKVTSAMWTAG